ncbi:MAG: thioredoxin family protein [Gammaproteobacteria bacterium]|nr:thioredoxin family protein [Gammaproteobacteria bacterium]MBI5617614.1 thioredoxin family protein [Gammaproteobacteria bacterium]
MIIRNAILATLMSAGAATADAGTIEAYTQQNFDTLIGAGKPVIVDVAATWCPTCKAQTPVIEEVAKLPAYSGVAVLVLDFDTGKPALKQLRAGMQSTVLAFNRGKEVARSIGDTSRVGIERLFQQAAGN